MHPVFSELKKALVGAEDAIFLMLVCLIARGHALIEDVPGVGKTLLATSLARVCNVEFARVQATPDLLPSDILGFHLFDLPTGQSKYIQGPVLTNLLLVDEINRASPKTQSALLEAMEERRFTLDGHTVDLPEPFLVIATQNPVESVGTSPLPEAQLDRFLMRFGLGYPSLRDEVSLLSRYQDLTAPPALETLLDGAQIVQMQHDAGRVHVSDGLKEYVVRLCQMTRSDARIALGCSPRASLALMHSAQAKALLHGRDFVVADDIQSLAPHVLAHRLRLSAAIGEQRAAAYSEQVIVSLLEKLPVEN